MFKNRCYNGGNRHKFSPRWAIESKPVGDLDLGRSSRQAALEMVKAFSHRKETYHGDVCEWCGKVVNNG